MYLCLSVLWPVVWSGLYYRVGLSAAGGGLVLPVMCVRVHSWRGWCWLIRCLQHASKACWQAGLDRAACREGATWRPGKRRRVLYPAEPSCSSAAGCCRLHVPALHDLTLLHVPPACALQRA
jgi:hypothetical protein